MPLFPLQTLLLAMLPHFQSTQHDLDLLHLSDSPAVEEAQSALSDQLKRVGECHGLPQLQLHKTMAINPTLQCLYRLVLDLEERLEPHYLRRNIHLLSGQAGHQLVSMAAD